MRDPSKQMIFPTLVILCLVLAVAAPAQERQRQARDANPRAGASTRSAPEGRQDTKDISRSRADKDSKKGEKRANEKPARTEDRNPSPAGGNLSPEQESWDTGTIQDTRRGRAVQSDHQRVFDNVRTGLNAGSVGTFSDMLGPQVNVDLRGGESGYFSAGQAYYVLERYMQANRITNLSFTTMQESAGVPFATGRTTIIKKGMNEPAQVYVSLSQVGGRWVISQIKIY